MTGAKLKLSAQREKEETSEVRENTLKKLQELVAKDVQRSHDREHIVDRENNQSPLYDADGFKIPVGKVPLDGQFSVTEVEELVQLGQEEGLKENVKVQVDNKTSAFSQLTILESDGKEEGEESDARTTEAE